MPRSVARQSRRLPASMMYSLLTMIFTVFWRSSQRGKPISAYAPERSIYLTSLSKSILPALRIGYLYAPPETLSRLSSMVRSSVWMPSPMMAQLASNVICSGMGERLVKAQQDEAAARQRTGQGSSWQLSNLQPAQQLPRLVGIARTMDLR